ncbi:MAG: choice-of-anchor L domain-containing protein [Proteobacteria bacterium]|nr:choice-of-anchor L domain-containing protein [Pseudomonadota bacterium]
MKISRLFIVISICCAVAGCSQESTYKADSLSGDNTNCQGNDCTNDQQKPTDPPADPQDPTDPPVDPPSPECGEDIDLMNDVNHCGACGHACVNATCSEGKCVCEDDYVDCDDNGTCESLNECICRPGQTTPCYEGDEGTEGIGQCHGGYHNCIVDETGSYWDNSACIDQVLPAQTLAEFTCDASIPDIDSDCNGIADAQQDEDQDGFAICKDGAILDCCDSQKWCNTTKPELINPGVTIDCNDNQLDDNCDGTVDEGELSCSEPIPCEGEDCGVEACKFDYGDCDQGLEWNNSNNTKSALLLAQSMDICMGKSSDPAKGALLEYSLHRSGYDKKKVAPEQVNILPGMKDKKGKTLIKPRLGHTFALLSTGEAKDVYNGVSTESQLYSDSYFDPSISMFMISVEDKIPDLYLSAHNHKLQSSKSCPSEKDPRIIDSVVLHLKLQAPQNAKGFSFDFRFFTREYPEYLCSEYNDFFLTLLTDEKGKPLQNKDGNISLDKKGYPISVNTAFFTTCYGCDSFDELYAYYPKPYKGTLNADTCGGGTAWLTTQAPIEGGQIFNLDFYIWDTHDSGMDSTVLLDNFRWLCDASLNTEFAPPAENPIEIN